MSKLQRVSNSKYRAVISDMLPYERPVFFTNRFFARFLKYYGIKSCDGMLVATMHEDTEGLSQFLEMLGGKPGVQRPCFQYGITKDGYKEGRILSIIHPYHQVRMAEFYDRYKMLLIDFCQRSHFSVRYPNKVATYKKKEKGYHKLFQDGSDNNDTKEDLKHYFSYKYYKNINFFYGDYRYLRAEKKFRRMSKLDLKSCFESIEPSSLSMAMFGHTNEQCEGSVAYEFCRLQTDFLNNKGGIVIGPEFSRIYAEIILQRIDWNVEQDLAERRIVRNADYVFYRYVDDGFLFYDDDNVCMQFFIAYIKRLGEYNLNLNKDKIISFNSRPFLEDISSAKIQLLKLIDDSFQNRLETFKGFLKMQKYQIDTPTKIDYKNFVNGVRSILRSEGKTVGYKDITSFLLGIIQKRTVTLLSSFNNLYAEYCKASDYGEISEKGAKIKDRFEREFVLFCMELIEILFYILGCDMRMSTSIKVVSVVNKLQIFVRGRYDISDLEKSSMFPTHYIEKIDEKISDEITSLLLNVIARPYNMMEILNILDLEKVMAQKTRIMPSALINFLNRCDNFEANLNFLTVFEIMHFVKDDSRYEDLRGILFAWIERKIMSLNSPDVSDTEAVLTFMETMSCPWVSYDKKQEYSKVLFGDDYYKVCKFAQRQKDLFVQWRNFKLSSALKHINSSEVY